MPGTIGLAAMRPTVPATLALIEQAESLGIPAVWLTNGANGPDALTLFAAAAARTERILLGTSIVPTWPRHPMIMAHQVQVISALAPGRFRLGIGPSHGEGIESTFGIPYARPLTHLREYISVLRQLAETGRVELDGDFIRAHGQMSAHIPMQVPVMASALQRRSFAFCGEEADGAITWICPLTYMKEVALPALREGAAKAGRPVPPLIAHAPVVVHENAEEVRAAAREQLAGYPRRPFYQRMLQAAGFPESLEARWTDEMIDAVVLHGDEETVAKRIEAHWSAGISEIIAQPYAAGSDREGSFDRTVRFLASLATAGA
jgi:F420-dependent oxidoreductase-like protein